MSEYSEDVMKAARGIVANIRADFTNDGRIDDAPAEEEEERVAHAIARAIMAERERCADLSKSEAEDYKAHDCLPQAMALFQFAREVMKPHSSAASSSPASLHSEQSPDPQ